MTSFNRIDAKLSVGQRPNFLAIHAVRCIYFGHTVVIQKRLRAKGFAWMLRDGWMVMAGCAFL